MLQPRLIVADEPVSMIDASLRATVLASLRKLNQDFRISLIYITHDLTTAYQIAEDIVTLYRGSVTESGDVERVVKEPQHPYTQLLVGSIPMPDPRHKWGSGLGAIIWAREGGTGTGCKFWHPCPRAMPRCRDAHPPSYRTHGRQEVAGYLYENVVI